MNRRTRLLLRQVARVIWFMLAALGFWSACVMVGMIYSNFPLYLLHHYHK